MVTLNDLIQVQSQRPQCVCVCVCGVCVCVSVILAVRWEPRADLTVWFHRVSGGPGRFWGRFLQQSGLKH